MKGKVYKTVSETSYVLEFGGGGTDEKTEGESGGVRDKDAFKDLVWE